MRRVVYLLGHVVFMCQLFSLLSSCEDRKEHIAAAILDRDSVAMMTSYGVNTLISDSGVIKYRIVTERWEVNQARNPSRWIFDKGLFLEQFDEKFHVESYIQCDTAYYFDQMKLWELRSRVRILTKHLCIKLSSDSFCSKLSDIVVIGHDLVSLTDNQIEVFLNFICAE